MQNNTASRFIWLILSETRPPWNKNKIVLIEVSPKIYKDNNKKLPGEDPLYYIVQPLEHVFNIAICFQG